MKVAVYPGSFDPITFGHIDIAKRALKVFDKLIIIVSDNPYKKGLFTAEERIGLIKECFKDVKENIEFKITNSLTVHETKRLGATHIVRGLRAVTDFEYEFQLTHANRVLDRTIDSVFFMTDNKYSFLSSTTVKEIAMFGGELKEFVPEFIAQKTLDKVKKEKDYL